MSVVRTLPPAGYASSRICSSSSSSSSDIFSRRRLLLSSRSASPSVSRLFALRTYPLGKVASYDGHCSPSDSFCGVSFFSPSLHATTTSSSFDRSLSRCLFSSSQSPLCLCLISSDAVPYKPKGASASFDCLFGSRREMRHRAQLSKASYQSFNIDNPLTAKHWPPALQIGNPITLQRCRATIHHLHLLEMSRMRKLRPFVMPRVVPGDCVQIKYELSRSQQTFASFKGYCIEVRHKRLNSSFILKNTFDGVGVEQLIPRYSPRLLSVQLVKKMLNPLSVDKRPVTRDYRYKWHNFFRQNKSPRTWVHPLGIKSLEMKLRRRLSKIRIRYMRQRVEAGLPNYVWKGPYQLMKKTRIKPVKAEVFRRQLVYSHDEQESRRQRLRKKRQKEKWGVFKLRQETSSSAVSRLPSYHPLSGRGSLPA